MSDQKEGDGTVTYHPGVPDAYEMDERAACGICGKEHVTIKELFSHICTTADGGSEHGS
jgi:hypothetical protein